jgi:hypothetical protein
MSLSTRHSFQITANVGATRKRLRRALWNRLQIVSKRFAKKQQMQWTKKSAHLVLQMRTQVLDERLEETFRDWYPDFRTKPPENEIQQAA